MSQKLVSDGDREVYEIINYVFITAIISLFGIVANLLNIIVFYTQGFHSTINISFFGLAVADLCSLLTVLWFTVCVNPLFVHADTFLYPPDILHLTAGIPHICFVRITGWITVFVTAERCLCITSPLKVKQIITPKVTILVVCAIYSTVIISFIPEYETSFIGWKFYPQLNATLLGLVFTNNRKNMEGIVFLMYSVLGSLSFIVVIVLTLVLVVQLKQKAKWRQKSNLDKASSQCISTRESKTTNMVVLIAAVLIVCYTPGVIASLSSFLYPEYSVAGDNVNLFYITWSFVFIFEALNSSVNIFLYYNMSTKYRETFLKIFSASKSPVV